jgi:hypothetical protein
MTSLVKENYSHIRKMTDRSKPGSTEILKLRKHHLSSCELSCVGRAWSNGVWVAPYRKGIRSCFVGALWELGKDIPHRTEDVCEKFIDIAALTNLRLGTVLESYRKRRAESEGPKNMIDIGRELQRLSGMHPYGLKLAQIGHSVDILTIGGGVHIRLASHVQGTVVVPQNDLVTPYRKNIVPATAELSSDLPNSRRWTTIREIRGCNCDGKDGKN